MTETEVQIRPAGPDDLEAIRSIQALSPEASWWEPESYLSHDCTVAVVSGRVVGFLVTRTVAPGEHEVLNMAIDPLFRRRGIATVLLKSTLSRLEGALFLEVRESNQAARRLYGRLGFSETGLRGNYYRNPSESAVVMRFQSC